jgi:SAM-dependent methyltransferase
MQTRESNMPEEDIWATFFRPDRALRRLGLTRHCRDVIEFGCGYGTFTIVAAQVVSGTVFACDIDPAMVATTGKRARQAGARNIVAYRDDFTRPDFPPPSDRVDYAMLFNILHAEHPQTLLGLAHRVLQPGGLLAIMHWNYDPSTPRGPSMDIRPRPEQCRDWAVQAGFTLLPSGIVNLPPYHYGMTLRRLA